MERPVDPELLSRLARPAPRYTSYPTSPHFHEDVGADAYARWLKALPPGARLSLYVHIPYCDTLCWFCACTTKITRRYEPVAKYLGSVCAEIGRVAGHVSPRARVTHLHWGGGSPDILVPGDIARLGETLKRHFNVAPDAEFAVEIDPRAMHPEKTDALVRAGVTRVSVGVQDFDPCVQDAINRHQSFEETRDVIERFREAGVASVNIDLVYGLPRQTPETAGATIDAVLSLHPDRVAIFGYAHLPERVRHQRLIPGESVPGPERRLALAQLMNERLAGAGYLRVGMDHFCKPSDAMARGPVRRNFQGYTTDTADALLGFGASAISRLPAGYVQNAAAIAGYRRRIEQGGLASERGVALTDDDRARAFAIETLLCELRFPARELRERFGAVGIAVAGEGARLESYVEHGLIVPAREGFTVTEKGRPFLRALAGEFDAYLGASAAVHSTGV